MLTIKNFQERLTPMIFKSSFRGWYIMEANEKRGDYYSINLQKNDASTDFDWVEIRLVREVDKDFSYDTNDIDDAYKLQFVHKDGSVIYEHWLSHKWLKKTTAIGFMNRMAEVIEKFVVNHPNNKWPVV